MNRSIAAWGNNWLKEAQFLENVFTIYKRKLWEVCNQKQPQLDIYSINLTEWASLQIWQLVACFRFANLLLLLLFCRKNGSAFAQTPEQREAIVAKLLSEVPLVDGWAALPLWSLWSLKRLCCNSLWTPDSLINVGCWHDRLSATGAVNNLQHKCQGRCKNDPTSTNSLSSVGTTLKIKAFKIA